MVCFKHCWPCAAAVRVFSDSDPRSVGLGLFVGFILGHRGFGPKLIRRWGQCARLFFCVFRSGAAASGWCACAFLSEPRWYGCLLRVLTAHRTGGIYTVLIESWLNLKAPTRAARASVCRVYGGQSGCVGLGPAVAVAGSPMGSSLFAFWPPF